MQSSDCGKKRAIEKIPTHRLRKAKLECVSQKVAHRNRPEEALRQSEEYFRALTENSSDIIIVVDKKGNISYVSSSIERFSGYKPEELIGKSAFEFIHPGDLPRAINDFGKAVQTTGVPIANSFRVRHKDGSERVLEGLGKNLLDNPLIAGFVMNVRDVTERKKAEEALKKSEEKFRNIFENSNVGISVTSLDGTFNANTVFCDMLGYSKEELSRVKWMDITLQEDIALSNNYLGQLRSGKKKSVRFEKRYIKKDGSIIFADASVTLQKDKDGRPPYYITTIMDITERKKAEKALRESEEKWRSLVKNAPNMIIIVNRDSTIHFINGTVSPLTIEETIGKSIYDYIEPEYQNLVRETIEHVLQTGEPGRYEIRGIGPHGRSSWYETHVGPIKHDQQIVAVTLITTDISEHKEAEEALKTER